MAPDVFELRWLEEFVEKFAGVEDGISCRVSVMFRFIDFCLF